MSDDAGGSDEFAFRTSVDVRFRDIDAGGHAHHTLVLVYFEEARSAYWSEVVGREGIGEIDFILAGCAVRFRGRIFWPQRLTVGARVSHLGRSHWEMAYEVRGEEGELLADGETSQVMYDYDRGRPKRIPPEVRERIAAFEGEGLSSGS